MQPIVPFLLFLFITLNSLGQEQKFLMPLKGTAGKDFFIDYYVDHDSTSGVKDVFCGSKTYNGHRGTDFLLRDFKAMDSGVYIYAAADGIVFEATDGEYDRNKHWVGGNLGNHVAIMHKNEVCTYYGHMMKNSLKVKIRDSVKAGQPIGKVGSSGYSCYAHLHFEVRDYKTRKIVDPFYGGCSTNENSYWIAQPPYDTSKFSIESGFVPYQPGIDSLKESFMVTDMFYTSRDTTICFWVLLHGLRAGDKMHFEWFTPGNRLWSQFDNTWKYNWWHDYTWCYIKMPKIDGKWLAKLFVNDKLINSRRFTIKK